MTRLAAGKKPTKKKSEFQKLWAKAERLKQENARFRDRMDEIVQRIETEIRPAEEAAAAHQIPLLKRLLVLGQRKSLLLWQRETLDDWIREILQPLLAVNSLDHDILEEVSRYDGFRWGVELDETSAISLQDQLRAYLEQEQSGLQGADDAWRQKVHREVETILDQTLGPEPVRPEPHGQAIGDFFGDELIYEQQRQYEADVKARNAARDELLKKILTAGEHPENAGGFADFGANPFGFDSKAIGEDDSEAPAAISDALFKRMFRSIAARLHPDREQDPAMRQEKHTLMTRLLDARKQGDVMTIVSMFQEHANKGAALSKADEKQLIQALQDQVVELQYEQEDYSLQSPLYQMAYEQFYFTHRKRTDQAFEQYSHLIESAASEARVLALSITSLKALKPHLELRYDERSFSALEGIFDIE